MCSTPYFVRLDIILAGFLAGHFKIPGLWYFFWVVSFLQGLNILHITTLWLTSHCKSCNRKLIIMWVLSCVKMERIFDSIVTENRFRRICAQKFPLFFFPVYQRTQDGPGGQKNPTPPPQADEWATSSFKFPHPRTWDYTSGEPVSEERRGGFTFRGK